MWMRSWGFLTYFANTASAYSFFIYSISAMQVHFHPDWLLHSSFCCFWTPPILSFLQIIKSNVSLCNSIELMVFTQNSMHHVVFQLPWQLWLQTGNITFQDWTTEAFGFFILLALFRHEIFAHNLDLEQFETIEKLLLFKNPWQHRKKLFCIYIYIYTHTTHTISYN